MNILYHIAIKYGSHFDLVVGFIVIIYLPNGLSLLDYSSLKIIKVFLSCLNNIVFLSRENNIGFIKFETFLGGHQPLYEPLAVNLLSQGVKSWPQVPARARKKS